jgi:hypothetical protein
VAFVRERRSVRGWRRAIADWAYLFGAVCPARDAGAAEQPRSSDAMNPIEITRASHRAVMPSSFSTVQAGVRPAADCRYRTTSACLHLPPYSPELNPVENISQYLRQNQVSNRVFANYDTIVEHAAKPGTPSWPLQTASAQSQHDHGHRSFKNDVGTGWICLLAGGSKGAVESAPAKAYFTSNRTKISDSFLHCCYPRQ